MVFPDSSEYLPAGSSRTAGEESSPTPPLPRSRQSLLNASLYVAFVFVAVLMANTITHFCPLKCTPVEVAIQILTTFLAPFSFFLAKSPRSLFLRVAGCGALSIALSIAYESWLHSPSFPQAWLDPIAQEWRQEADKPEAHRALEADPLRQ